MSPAQLVAQINAVIQGWPAPPSTSLATIGTDGKLKLAVGSSAADLSGTEGRLGDVLKKLYDPATGTVATQGTMPLAGGRLRFAGTPPYEVPLLGTPAWARIDTTAAPFAAANLSKPLAITVLGKKYTLTLSSGEGTPEALAGRIAASIEGVRAWSDGTGGVIVETVAAGDQASLKIEKDPGGVLFDVAGQSAVLPGATAQLSDTTAISPSTLKAVIDDASSRAALAGIVAANPQAALSGKALVITVAAGHEISPGPSGFTGTAPFTLKQVKSNKAKVSSGNLPDPMVFAGPAWLDLVIDTQPVRIPLDGEPARVELGILDHVPASPDTLDLTVGGAASPTTVAFAKDPKAGMADAAAAIAAASKDVTVRLAYQLSAEHTLYCAGTDLTLTYAASSLCALAQAGFVDPAGLTAHAVGFGSDALSVPAALDGPDAAKHRDGVAVNGFSIAGTGSGGSQPPWSLTAVPDHTIQVTTAAASTAGADPLGFPTTPWAAFTLPGGVVDLKAQCRQYTFDLKDASGNTAAQGVMQITATPAILRGVRTAMWPLPSSTLGVAIKKGEAEQIFTIDLSAATGLDDVAQQLNAATPALAAWVLRPSGGIDVLHVETVECGTACTLTLTGAATLRAMGFSVPAGDALTANGGGTVADWRAVTQAEIKDALQRACDCMTGAESPQFAVALASSQLRLTSPLGKLTIVTDPDTLKGSLVVSETAAVTTLSPPDPASLENGTIVVKAGEKTLGAAQVWGQPARLSAAHRLDSLDPVQQIAWLGQPIAITVGSQVHGSLQIPAAILTSTAATTLEDAVEWLQAQVPEAWIGLVDGVVVIESRQAGKTAYVKFDSTSAGAPVLGFGSISVEAKGRGTVDDISQVPLAALEGLLVSAAAGAAVPQSFYSAAADTSVTPNTLNLTPNSPAWTLTPTLDPADPGPASLAFAGSGVLAAPLHPHRILPGVFSLDADVDHGTWSVTALLHTVPARLPDLILPTQLSPLAGAGFDLTVGNSTTYPVVFKASATLSPAEIAAQIEHQCQWTVRATANASTLRIETVDGGSKTCLTLADPANTATKTAITNDPNGIATAALKVQHWGSGGVPDTGVVSASDLAPVLLNGYAGAPESTTAPNQAAVTLDPAAYLAEPARDYFRLSDAVRDGCISAVIPIVNLSAALALDRSLERSPAIHACVCLLPITAPVDLQGTLNIQLNENPGAKGLPSASVVPVVFAGGHKYSAEDVARQIHAELFHRGLGHAAAFPDGTVVVETSMPGLAGTVRIPAQNTATAGPDQNVAKTLVGSEKFARGWPGTGMNTPGGALIPGFRSDLLPAAAGKHDWKFTVAPKNVSAAVTIANGTAIADIASQLDNALANASGGRIGLCAVGPDKRLYIEAMAPNTTLTLEVDGAPLPVDGPSAPGDTPERRAEPALGLRRTDETRTFRFARERFGNPDPTELDDVGWVRIPADVKTGAPGKLVFPFGFYWLSVRADGARSNNYDGSGDMIVSGAVDPKDPHRTFVQAARYWCQLGSSVNWLQVVKTGDDFLVRVLLGG